MGAPGYQQNLLDYLMGIRRGQQATPAPRLPYQPPAPPMPSYEIEPFKGTQAGASSGSLMPEPGPSLPPPPGYQPPLPDPVSTINPYEPPPYEGPPLTGVPQPTQAQTPSFNQMLGTQTRGFTDNRYDPNALPPPPPPIVDYGDSKNQRATQEIVGPIRALPRNPGTDRTQLEDRQAPPMHQRQVGGSEPIESTAAPVEGRITPVRDLNEAINRPETENALNRIIQGAGQVLSIPLNILGHGFNTVQESLGMPDAVNRRAMMAAHRNLKGIMAQYIDKPGGMTQASYDEIFNKQNWQNQPIPGFGVRPSEIPGGELLFEKASAPFEEVQGDLANIPPAIGIPKYQFSRQGIEEARAREKAKEERAGETHSIQVRAAEIQLRIAQLEEQLKQGEVRRDPIKLKKAVQELSNLRAEEKRIKAGTGYTRAATENTKMSTQLAPYKAIAIPLAQIQAQKDIHGAAESAAHLKAEAKRLDDFNAAASTLSRRMQAGMAAGSKYLQGEPDISDPQSVVRGNGLDYDEDTGGVKWGYYPEMYKHGYMIPLPSGSVLDISSGTTMDESLRAANTLSQALRWWRDNGGEPVNTEQDASAVLRQWKKAMAEGQAK